jgi:hypothetical protein
MPIKEIIPRLEREQGIRRGLVGAAPDAVGRVVKTRADRARRARLGKRRGETPPVAAMTIVLFECNREAERWAAQSGRVKFVW